MFQRIFILFFLISTLFSFGQKTTFEENINYKARLLKQEFNENNDSLTLSSDKIITQVDIFNDDYIETIDINDNEANINLGELPLGEFVIQARVEKKRIIMYVTRTELLDHNISNTRSINNSPTEIEATVKIQEQSNAEKKFITAGYWVIYERNSKMGSYKSMRLEDEYVVKKMIARNRLELNTDIGKNNKLLVFEVYNTSEFMRNQLKNTDYINSEDSEIFNNIPFYISENQNTLSKK